MKLRDVATVLLIVGVAVSLSLLAPVSFAQGEWTQRFLKSDHGTLIEFDGPDASTSATLGTLAFANNDFGAVVGSWVDSKIIPHAFLRTPEGKFIGFDAPGADLNKGDNGGTVAYAINNLGVIAGQFEDTSFVFHAFIRYPNGFIYEFDDPNAGSTPFAFPAQGTQAANIYVDSGGNEHGFIRYHDGNIVTVDPENSLGTMICLETCLTDDGATTGFYFDSNTLTVRGFIRSPGGQYTVFDGPQVNDQAAQGTTSGSINAFGVTAGYSLNAEQTAGGFIRTPNGQIFGFQDPAASTNAGLGTAAFAVNIFGVTTGIYQDSNGGSHGFERTPNGLYANFDAPDNGDNCVPALFLCQGTRPSTNNFWGEVAGWYVDSSSVFHGLIWIPGPGSFQLANNSNAVASKEIGAAAADASAPVGGRASAAASGSGSQPTMSILSRFSPRDVGARILIQKWLAGNSH
jgi:hypothetical protein